MDIPLDYYRVFYYVARFRSITQAARALGSNQPNVTRTIQQLERAAGCRLFERSHRGVALTPEGETLYPHIEKAMLHLENAQQALTLERALGQGRISIGASEVALRCLLLPVLRRFHEMYPNIQVRLSNHSTPQAVQALQEGLVDLAVVTTPVELAAGMEKHPLKTIQEVPVCTKALAAKLPARCGPEQLCRSSLVSLGRDTMTYRMYEEWFAANGLPFQPDVEAATADQILPLVRNGLGIGFVPEEFLSQETGLYRIPLTVPVPTRQICLIQTSQPQSIAAKKFLSLLESACAMEEQGQKT